MAAKIQESLSIIRLKQLAGRVGLSRSTIYSRVAEGTFPKPISLGLRSVGWIEAEVDAWLRERLNASRNEA